MKENSLKELDLLEAIDVYCNFNPSEGGDNKDKLMQTAKQFTKDDISSTIEFVESTHYGSDQNIKNTLQKLYQAR